MLFKFKGFGRCPQKMTVHSVAGIALEEHQCVFPANHPGQHSNGERVVWSTPDKMRRLLEDKGTSL